VSLLEDNRKNPDIDIKKIFIGYYYGSALRMKATSTIEEETRNGILKNRVGNISDDTIGYGLDHLDVETIQKGWYMLARRVKRNGMLRDSPFHDYIVGVFDGIETYSSYNRHCPWKWMPESSSGDKQRKKDSILPQGSCVNPGRI